MSQPICNGIVQRGLNRLVDGQFVAWTEWLACADPVEWTPDSVLAFVFPGNATHTGYERAALFADALNAASGTVCHHPCVRSQARAPKEPPMPPRRAVRRRAPAASEDWRSHAANSGVL